MKWPQFMSKKFWHLKETESFEEAFSDLEKKGQSHVIEFFIESCEDRTWITSGGEELMRTIFAWLTRQYREELLSDADAKAIAQAIQKQFKALEGILDYDADFVIEGKVIPVCGFMFQAQSPFFKELFKRTRARRRRKVLEMPKIKLAFFDYIKEFVYTGKIEFLWREEPKYILNFIRQAQKLGMQEMSAYTSEVYKRYLNPKNVIPHLRLAQKEFLRDLEKECCRYANEQNFGIMIEHRDTVGLQVTFESITEIGLMLVDYLSRQISYLVCRGRVPSNPEIIVILNKIKHLVGLDLSGSSEISGELLENFPAVKQLNLSGCQWLDDERLLAIIQSSPGLVQLNLSKNTQLTFRSLGELTILSRLGSLDLSYCDQLNDDDFDLVASSCPQIAELYLRFCRIGDDGLKSIAERCQNLAVLDLTDCKKISKEGIEQLRLARPNLELRFSSLNV